jgi:hypothetical protein
MKEFMHSVGVFLEIKSEYQMCANHHCIIQITMKISVYILLGLHHCHLPRMYKHYFENFVCRSEEEEP